MSIVIASSLFILVTLLFQCNTVVVVNASSTEKLIFEMSPLDLSTKYSTFQNLNLQACAASNSYYTNVSYSIASFAQTFSLPPNKYVIFEYELVRLSANSEEIKIRTSPSNQPVFYIVQPSDYITISGEQQCEPTFSDNYFSGCLIHSLQLTQSYLLISPMNGTKIGFYSMRLFVELCDPSCPNCSLTSPFECTGCSGGATLVNGKCQCANSSKKIQEGLCVSSCTGGYLAVGSSCVHIPNCTAVDASGKCTTCKNSQFVSKGVCVDKCGVEQGQTANNCIDNYTAILNPTSRTHIHAFYEQSFSSKSIQVEQFTVTRASAVSSNFATSSRCGSTDFILGQFVGRLDAKITFPSLQIVHTHLYIRFYYILIDPTSTSDIKITIRMNAYTGEINDTSGFSSIQVCGSSTADFTGQYQNTLKLQDTPNTSNPLTFNVEIENESTSNSFSLGIRDVFIFTYNCNDANCKSCTIQQCSECMEGYFLDNMSNCIPCTNGVVINNVCILCTTNCVKCTGSGLNECLTCDVNAQMINGNSCLSCKVGYFLNGSSVCQQCDSNCYQCQTSESQCISCSGSLFVINGKCRECKEEYSMYASGTQCLPCDATCKTCTGPSDLDCKICQDGYYFSAANNNKCIPCSDTKCSLCDKKSICDSCSGDLCSICFGFDTQTLVNQDVCLQCSNNLPIFKGECVDSCNDIGEGFSSRNINLSGSQMSSYLCTCPSPTNSIIRETSTNNLMCLDGLPLGYYCQSNRPCVECKNSCEKCNSSSSCSKCQSGHFMWRNECRSSCFSSLSIMENSENRTCECESGKVLKKRDSSEINQLESNEEYMCLYPLKLEMIEVINALSKPKYRDDIPSVVLTNFFILTFNRRPTQEEFLSFTFLVMKDVLKIDVEYRILQAYIQNKSSSILIEVEMVDKNRKIADISVKIDTINDRLYLSNVIGVTKKFSEKVQENESEGASENVTEGLGSIANTLTNSDSEIVNSLIRFSKQFQIACSLSNFVQLLTPIYFLNQSLPVLVKYGSLLGAAFIFDTLPNSQQVEYSTSKEEEEVQRMLSQSTPETAATASESKIELAQMLKSFGLSSNIFANCIGVHVMVFSSVVMMVVCYTGRKVFKGKQYTILLIEKLANFVTSQHQSTITMILSIVALCMSSGEGVFLAWIYLGVYTVIYLQLFYLSFFKSVEYLKANIPNFFVDLNPSLKGAKWYLFTSFCKKHLAICLLLTLYRSAYVCCILISILFISTAAMFSYFRYFSSIIITSMKIVQELAVSFLFGLIAHTIKSYMSVIESDTIEDEALLEILKLANLVLIFIIVCVLLSFLFSFYRLLKQIQDLYQAYKKYQISKKRSIEDILELEEKTEIQMQSGMSLFVKEREVNSNYSL